MNQLTCSVLFAFSVSAMAAACTRAPEPITCADLTRWGGEDVSVVSAEALAASPELPGHCKVTGTIDDEIKFELLLPEAWNGKFLMGGGGGFVGSVQNEVQSDFATAGGTALDRGYATVGTDTGHEGSAIDASWALDAPEREENFAHRAVHRTAEIAKAIIGDYYAGEIGYSYFFGCSRGGGQALISAQRYPADFDGVIAGAPAMDWSGLATANVYAQQAIFPDADDLSTPVITAENRALLGRALLASCDGIDGLGDGIIDDPRNCPFDPADLLRCAAGAPGPDCLTEAQLTAVQAVYGGPEVDGEQLHPGFPFGGENDEGGWDRWLTARPGSTDAVPNLGYAFGTQIYKYLVYDDPDWDYSTYDFSNWHEDTAAAATLLNSTDPDLSAFRDAGGKLLLWHGWSDVALTAFESIEYYEKVENADPSLRDYFRLFMMPGVLHCAGGPGPDRIDWIAALEAWVERGESPEQLLAAKRDADGNTMLTRPLCSYPRVARWDGQGDPNDASSFSCVAPE